MSYTKINGANFYYQVDGEGLPLLLIHAGVADSGMWEEQAAGLAGDFRVIRYDLRGFGQTNMPPGRFSNIDDAKDLLDHLGIKKAVIAGCSFGSSIALDFALAFPERTMALIMCSPSVNGDQPSERIQQFWTEEEGLLELDDFTGATELNLKLWVDGPFRSPDQVDPVVRKKVGEMQMLAFQAEIPEDIEEIDLEPPAFGRLGEVNTPALIIAGALDLEEKVELARLLAGKIPDTEMVIIEDAAHLPNMEKPEIFNQRLIDFADKVKSG